MGHKVEVDQSIKIEDKAATVLAFANDIADAVIIPVPVKRKAQDVLLLRGKSKGIARLLVFCAGLYLLLQRYLDSIKYIEIDIEYQGHDAHIREFLLNYIWRTHPQFESWRITFKHVGKTSPAHRKAEAVRPGKDGQFRRLNETELLAVFNNIE